MGEVKSLRMSDETKAAFDKIAHEVGGNQEATMRVLLDAYNLRTIAEMYPESRVYLEDIMKYTSGIENVVRSLVAAKENAEETAMKTVRDQMESRDRTIADYQKQVSDKDALEARLVEAEEKLKKAEENALSLASQVKSLLLIKDSVDKAQQIYEENIALREQNASLRAEVKAQANTIATLQSLFTGNQSQQET